MDTIHVYSQDSQRMALNLFNQVLIKAEPTRLCATFLLMYFLRTYLLPICDQTYPVQLRQPTVFPGVKIFDLLPVLGQVGLIG